MRRPPVERWLAYCCAILLAATGEALLVHLLGASAAAEEAARGAAASLALALLLDLVAMACTRLPGWKGRLAAASCGLALLLVPGPMTLYERMALRGEVETPASRTPLALLTGLPLVWAEGGIAEAMKEDGNGAFELLSAAYAVRLIDAVGPSLPISERLLLIAQARPPGPAGLVAIDGWVRNGGRALILTDPDLRWPSEYGLGDPRRPPADDGLVPLLWHWGLALERREQAGALATRDIDGQRIILAAPGRFAAHRPGCSVAADGLMADCRLGRGRALLVADADLLHDLLWKGPGPIGMSRAGRLADNAAFVIRKLGELEGRTGSLRTDRVDWIGRNESSGSALLAAFAAPLSALAIGLLLAMSGRRASAKKDSYRFIHRPDGKTKQEQ